MPCFYDYPEELSIKDIEKRNKFIQKSFDELFNIYKISYEILRDMGEIYFSELKNNMSPYEYEDFYGIGGNLPLELDDCNILNNRMNELTKLICDIHRVIYSRGGKSPKTHDWFKDHLKNDEERIKNQLWMMYLKKELMLSNVQEDKIDGAIFRNCIFYNFK